MSGRPIIIDNISSTEKLSARISKCICLKINPKHKIWCNFYGKFWFIPSDHFDSHLWSWHSTIGSFSVEGLFISLHRGYSRCFSFPCLLEIALMELPGLPPCAICNNTLVCNCMACFQPFPKFYTPHFTSLKRTCPHLQYLKAHMKPHPASCFLQASCMAWLDSPSFRIRGRHACFCLGPRVLEWTPPGRLNESPSLFKQRPKTYHSIEHLTEY